MDNSEGFILKQMTIQSDDIFFIFNTTERHFKFVNIAFEEVTRRKSSELFKNPGLLLKIVFKEDLQYVKLNFKALLNKEISSLLNFRVVRPDKTTRWIRLKVYPILENSKIQYLCGMGEDDTARIASVFNMQKVNGWKNSTLEILSHDLRGPIGTVENASLSYCQEVARK